VLTQRSAARRATHSASSFAVLTRGTPARQSEIIGSGLQEIVTAWDRSPCGRATYRTVEVRWISAVALHAAVAILYSPRSL